MKKFLLKINRENQAPIVVYVDPATLRKGHFYLSFCPSPYNVYGMLYGGEVKYSDLTTLLTEEEFKAICCDDNINYHAVICNAESKGINIPAILNKVESEENEKLFEQVIQEEKDYLINKEGMREDDVNYLFDCLGDRKDSSALYGLFKNEKELGEYYVDDNYDVDSFLENYIDYEAIGRNLLEDDSRYLKLPSGLIAEYAS